MTLPLEWDDLDYNGQKEIQEAYEACDVNLMNTELSDYELAFFRAGFFFAMKKVTCAG